MKVDSGKFGVTTLVDHVPFAVADEILNFCVLGTGMTVKLVGDAPPCCYSIGVVIPIGSHRVRQ